MSEVEVRTALHNHAPFDFGGRNASRGHGHGAAFAQGVQVFGLMADGGWPMADGWYNPPPRVP